MLACYAHSAKAAGDPPDVTYHSHANEVRLTFSVTDQNHHAVATLQAGDFAVVDKDIIVRKFQSFTRSDITKLEIAILVDASGSVAPRFAPESSELLDLLSHTAGIPEQSVSVFSFRDLQPKWLCSGTCRTAHPAALVSIPRRNELTPLFDSIVFASDFVAQRADHDAQKIIIVLSDGQDSVSRHSLQDATGAAMKAAVQIYAIDLNRNPSSQGSAILYRFADATGGRYFSGPNATDRAMNVILEDFQASYIVTYKLPSNDSGFHALRVLPTHDRSLQFRSRSGYYISNH
jgi:VWFA-related protein